MLRRRGNSHHSLLHDRSFPELIISRIISMDMIVLASCIRPVITISKRMSISILLYIYSLILVKASLSRNESFGHKEIKLFIRISTVGKRCYKFYLLRPHTLFSSFKFSCRCLFWVFNRDLSFRQVLQALLSRRAFCTV